jgi:hypothetical protein
MVTFSRDNADPHLTNEELVRNYARASAEGDQAEMTRLRHPDWTVDWPQTGERVRGSDNFNSVMDNYPGGRPSERLANVVGAHDRWVATPANTIVRIAGEGDWWWGDWRMTYPDGSEWFCVDLMEVRDGAIVHETVYWAPPLETPAWRAGFVERIQPGPG